MHEVFESGENGQIRQTVYFSTYPGTSSIYLLFYIERQEPIIMKCDKEWLKHNYDIKLYEKENLEIYIIVANYCNLYVADFNCELWYRCLAKIYPKDYIPLLMYKVIKAVNDP